LIAIVLNGESKDIANGQTILDLLRALNLPEDRLAVEHNLKIVKRENWGRQPLNDGDKVEIVQFVGGGSEGFCSKSVGAPTFFGKAVHSTNLASFLRTTPPKISSSSIRNKTHAA